MDIHSLKSENQDPGKKFSEVLSSSCFISKDSLNLSFKRISEIDKCEEHYTKATTLNLSYNLLEDLSGIEQFKHLSHIALNQNNLKRPENLHGITSRVSILNLEGNPCVHIPNFTAYCLQRFPNLKELNGFRVNDHTRQDFRDACILSEKVLPFLSKLEFLLDFREWSCKMVKVHHSLVAVFKQDHDKSVLRNISQNIPKVVLPNYSNRKNIRPFMLLNVLDVSRKLVIDVDEDTNFQRIYDDLFKEITSSLRKMGNFSLDLYLNRENTEFSDLIIETENRLVPFDQRPTMKENRKFPVIFDSSDYLKAMLSILESKIQAVLKTNENFAKAIEYTPELPVKIDEEKKTQKYSYSVFDSIQTKHSSGSDISKHLFSKLFESLSKVFTRPLFTIWKTPKIDLKEAAQNFYFKRTVKKPFNAILLVSLRRQSEKRYRAEAQFRKHAYCKIFKHWKQLITEKTIRITTDKTQGMITEDRTTDKTIKRKRRKSSKQGKETKRVYSLDKKALDKLAKKIQSKEKMIENMWKSVKHSGEKKGTRMKVKKMSRDLTEIRNQCLRFKHNNTKL